MLLEALQEQGLGLQGLQGLQGLLALQEQAQAPRGRLSLPSAAGLLAARLLQVQVQVQVQEALQESQRSPSSASAAHLMTQCCPTLPATSVMSGSM